MTERVRWYNRIAAWLCEHDPVHDFLIGLATPVWAAEAMADEDAMWDWEHDARLNEAASQAYNDGLADGYREAEHDYYRGESEVPF